MCPPGSPGAGSAGIERKGWRSSSGSELSHMGTMLVTNQKRKVGLEW